jgi:hypothetical protein
MANGFGLDGNALTGRLIAIRTSDHPKGGPKIIADWKNGECIPKGVILGQHTRVVCIPDNILVKLLWGCPDSPFDGCVYDAINDGACDQCLFCGQPYERK